MTDDHDPMNRDMTSDPFDRSETETGAAGSADGYTAGFFIKHRYEILAAGRRGGMGAVYHCRDHKLTMEKALKVVHPHLLRSPHALQRFRQEVSISLQLSHEGIVRVYDLDEDEGREFFTMEWVEGKSLRDLLIERKKEGRPFNLEEANRIISQLCDALQYAHRFTIHRDIKPENILVKQDGEAVRIKLTDFGIAKMLTASQFTTTSLQMGTPYYMAPEQKLDAANVDKRADIYAAGVVLFELLTLENTIGFDLPSEINPDLPKEIDAVIRKAMATRPENRYGDAGEFATALSAVAKANRARKEAERARLEAELAEQRNREEADRVRAEAERKKKEEKEAKARIAAEVAEAERLRKAEKERHEAEEGARKRKAEEKARQDAERKTAEEERSRKEEARKDIEAESQANREAMERRCREAETTGKKKSLTLPLVVGVVVIAAVVAFGVIRMRSSDVTPDISGGKGETSVPAPGPAPVPVPISVAPVAPAAPAPSVSGAEEKRKEGLKYLERAKAALEKGWLIEAREYYEDAQKRISEEKGFKEFGKKLVQAVAQAKREESSKTFTSSTTGAKFVLIPSRPLYMQTTEVTQGQWKKEMGNNPSRFNSCGDDCPVETVSWNDVQEFIRKLNQQEGTDKYRLPTEAEWEYAARAGTTTAYSFGDSEADLKDYGWYEGNSGNRTHPVGQKRPNAWGLYDVHGNVGEWLQDQGYRGGSWGYDARYCRSAVRNYIAPGDRYNNLGFRLARTK